MQEKFKQKDPTEQQLPSYNRKGFQLFIWQVIFRVYSTLQATSSYWPRTKPFFPGYRLLVERNWRASVLRFPLRNNKISHELDAYVVRILAEKSSNVGLPASFLKFVFRNYRGQVQEPISDDGCKGHMIRELKQRWRRRQQSHDRFDSRQNNKLHVQNAFLYISLPFLQGYNV